MTFAERRAQRDPSVPMRTVRSIATGEVIGHFLMTDERVVERIARPISDAAAEARPTFGPLDADGYRRLLDSATSPLPS